MIPYFLFNMFLTCITNLNTWKYAILAFDDCGYIDSFFLASAHYNIIETLRERMFKPSLSTIITENTK